MRPDLAELHARISHTLGSPAFTIASCKFTSNTDQWVARLEDISNSEKRYYRIAEGFGTNVTFVSPRMPFNVSVLPSQQGSSTCRSVHSKVSKAALETPRDKRLRERTQLEFDYCLDKLFEGRDD